MMEEILSNKWLKIGLVAVIGLVLTASLVFAGYQLGQKEVQPGTIERPTSVPFVTLFPTFTPFPTLAPTLQPEVSRPPDETADWKTYTNAKYRYSIKYPSDWFLSSTSEMEQSIRLSPINMYRAGYISLDVSPNAFRGVTRCEQDRSNCNFVIDNKIFGEKTESTTKDVIFLPGILGDYDMAVILYKGEKANSLTLNLMLSTFRFLE